MAGGGEAHFGARKFQTVMAYGVCSRAGCSKAGTKLCSQCGEAAYCSGECQKEAWITGHKEQCCLATKPEVVTMTQKMDDLSLKQLKNVVIAKAAQYNANRRAIILAKLEQKEKDKGQLLTLAAENVLVSEIEPLLTGRGGAASGGSSSGGGGGASTTLSSSGGKKVLSRKDKVKAALEEHKMPSVEQLRKQARTMSRNPELVRRANPEMRHLTDAQIREHAREMEKMASNPDMLNTMLKVQSLPEAERTALVQVQEGLAGKITRDEKWIDETVRLVKSRPDVLKELFKGRVGKDAPLSESQIISIIDYVATCSEGFLKRSVHAVNWGVIHLPGMYSKLDAATFGCARYLLLFIVLCTVLYLGKLIWYLMAWSLGVVMRSYEQVTGGRGNRPVGDSAFASAASQHPNDEAPFVEL